MLDDLLTHVWRTVQPKGNSKFFLKTLTTTLQLLHSLTVIKIYILHLNTALIREAWTSERQLCTSPFIDTRNSTFNSTICSSDINHFFPVFKTIISTTVDGNPLPPLVPPRRFWASALSCAAAWIIWPNSFSLASVFGIIPPDAEEPSSFCTSAINPQRPCQSRVSKRKARMRHDSSWICRTFKVVCIKAG